MTYKAAYRNEYTNWVWYELFVGEDLNAMIRSAQKLIAAELANSEVGIFAMPSGAAYWKDRRPCRLMNRQGNQGPIPQAIGNLINNKYIPGNNAR